VTGDTDATRRVLSGHKSSVWLGKGKPGAVEVVRAGLSLVEACEDLSASYKTTLAHRPICSISTLAACARQIDCSASLSKLQVNTSTSAVFWTRS